MTHVSIGSRSRSPFKPLSLRAMSRADFTSEPSDCAVERGGVGLGDLRDIEVGLQFVDGGA